jgi:hypothetical protein
MAVIGVNYLYTQPGGGGYQVSTTTAPTAAQAYYIQALKVLLTAGDADTTCTITTNFNLSAAEQTNLYPDISYIPNKDSLGTVAPVLLFTATTNTITLVKANTVAGSGGSYLVTISRPSTIVR